VNSHVMPYSAELADLRRRPGAEHLRRVDRRVDADPSNSSENSRQVPIE
jgi:hypothetical protein